MAVKTKCMTPGAVFHTHIGQSTIMVTVTLPTSLVLDEQGAIQLEGTIHNAMELALAPLFVNLREEVK